MKRIIALLMVCMGVALPYLKSVEVLPARADWSGLTNVHEPNNWVGQTFVANFDSAAQVQFFVGYVGDTSHHYDVNIYD